MCTGTNRVATAPALLSVPAARTRLRAYARATRIVTVPKVRGGGGGGGTRGRGARGSAFVTSKTLRVCNNSGEPHVLVVGVEDAEEDHVLDPYPIRAQRAPHAAVVADDARFLAVGRTPGQIVNQRIHPIGPARASRAAEARDRPAAPTEGSSVRKEWLAAATRLPERRSDGRGAREADPWKEPPPGMTRPNPSSSRLVLHASAPQFPGCGSRGRELRRGCMVEEGLDPSHPSGGQHASVGETTKRIGPANHPPLR